MPMSFVPARKSRSREGHSRGAMAIYQSRQWRLIQQEVRKSRPPCGAGCGNRATEIHHRKPLSEGGDAFSRDNLIFLCSSCHRVQHAS